MHAPIVSDARARLLAAVIADTPRNARLLAWPDRQLQVRGVVGTPAELIS